LNKKGKEIMISEIIEKLLTNVDSQKVNIVNLHWKIESAKQIANEQSVSTTEVNDRVVTSVKKNVRIKEILSADIQMEGNKETSRSSSKKDVETKMVLSTDIHLEGTMETNRSSSRKYVKTKEALSSDIQLGDSQEPSRSLSKKEVETKEVLNTGTYLKDRKETDRG